MHTNSQRNSQYPNGSMPPAYTPAASTRYTGYTQNQNSQYGPPSGIPRSAQTPSGYPPTNATRIKRTESVMCCDATYAKSKQGIFKLVMIILSFIAWLCVACTPYFKRIFVIGGQTWPFHLVMFLTITAFLALLIVYIIFTSGYHRKRKRKPWPTYELYFNVWLVIWFLTAALIECFNAWRWNYGPHTRRTDVGQMPGSDTRYDYSISNNNQGYAHGWDPKMYCQMHPADCQKRLMAELTYNGYYATHIFVCVCLWVLVVLSMVSSYHAFRLHQIYRNLINGVKPQEKTKTNINANYLTAIKHKFKGPKTSGTASGKSSAGKSTKTSVKTSNSQKSTKTKSSSRTDTLAKENFQPVRTSTKTGRDSATNKSINSAIDI